MLVLMVVFIDDIFCQFTLCLLRQRIMLLFQHLLANLHELFRYIVFKLEDIRETAFHSWIGLQHPVHLPRISCQDNNHIRIVRAEIRQQRFNDAHTIVFRVFTS